MVKIKSIIVKLGYLLLPQKRPEYRQNRSHSDFLCPLHPHFASKADLMSRLADNAQKRLGAELINTDTALAHLHFPHRRSTIQIDLD